MIFAELIGNRVGYYLELPIIKCKPIFIYFFATYLHPNTHDYNLGYRSVLTDFNDFQGIGAARAADWLTKCQQHQISGKHYSLL